jgi:hypothetical protein
VIVFRGAREASLDHQVTSVEALEKACCDLSGPFFVDFLKKISFLSIRFYIKFDPYSFDFNLFLFYPFLIEIIFQFHPSTFGFSLFLCIIWSLFFYCYLFCFLSLFFIDFFYFILLYFVDWRFNFIIFFRFAFY